MALTETAIKAAKPKDKPYMLVLQTPEKSLCAHIVQRTSLPIHRNLYSTALQQFQIIFIGEVAPLVGVDHFGTPARQRPIQTAHDKALVQTDTDLIYIRFSSQSSVSLLGSSIE